MTRVPLPPKFAETFDTVCQFCIVGCGYKVFKWPEGKDGTPDPKGNALGIDFSKQQSADGVWISPNMHTVVTDKDGSRKSVAFVPDQDFSVNSGLS